MTTAIMDAIGVACGFVVGFCLGDIVRNWLRLQKADVPGMWEQISDLQWQLHHEKTKRETAEAASFVLAQELAKLKRGNP